MIDHSSNTYKNIMEYKTESRKAHCLVVAYPAQGHINPMLNFCKRLQQHDEITLTLVTTRFFCNKLQKLPSFISLDTISDGFDNGGYDEAENAKVYFDRFREVGTQTLCELIEKLNTKGNDNHVDCLIYDPFLPWVLDVAKSFGLIGAIFLTQNLGVDSIYYHVNRGMLQLPLLEDSNISIPGLPSLVPNDMPSFLYEYGSEDTSTFDLLVGQFCDIEKADWILCNTVYELETEVW